MSASRNAWIHGATWLSVVLCIAGCTSPASKPHLSVSAQAEALSHFSLGLLAETAGDSDAALRHLTNAIEIDPGEPTLYPPAIAIALRIEQPDEALKLARQLRKKQPDSLPPRLLQAQVYVLTGQPEEAEVLFREAAADFPNDPTSTLLLAQFLISQERNTDAIDILEPAVKKEADHTELLHLLGTLYVNRARTIKSQPDARDSILEGADLLEKSLALSAENPKQWQQLGYAYLAIQEIEKATTTFEKAYALFPEDLMIAQQLLDLSIQSDSFERALALCEELPRQTHTEPELWIQYLSEKLPKEQSGLLIDYLQDYLKKHPQSPVFYYTQLGSLYLDQEQFTEAEALLQEALHIYPDDGRLRTVSGYLHLQQERYEEAYEAFRQVKNDTPDAEWTTNPFFTFNFMVAAQKSDRLAEAAEELAASYTNSPMILNQYVQALLRGETPISTAAAIDLLNTFHTLTPEAAEALYYLSLLQAEQEDYETALNNARQFETLANEKNATLLDGFFYYQYAVLHERNGNLNKAEGLFRKAIDFGEGSTTASAQNYIAYMWAERGEKLKMGLALVQSALTAEPDNAAFLDTLGWIYYRLGRYQEALDQLKKANELIGEVDPVLKEHLGDTYLKLGDRYSALEQWEKALELAPNNEQLIERIKTNQLSPDSSPSPADSPADKPAHP